MIDSILQAFNGLVKAIAQAWEYFKNIKEWF